MKILLLFFLESAFFLWISAFAHLLALNLMALKRRCSAAEVKYWPQTAIVVPVLNEESLILT